jgi:hypothetical protein
MSIIITQQNNPIAPEDSRHYAIYNGLILNWQVRAIEQLARELGTYEDEIVMAALSLFLAMHSDRMDLRDAILFSHEAPGKIIKTLKNIKQLRPPKTNNNHEVKK